MTYFITLTALLVGLPLLATLFLSGDKYVNIVTLLISSSLMIGMVFLAGGVLMFALIVGLFWQMLTGHDVVNDIAAWGLTPLGCAVKTLFGYCVLAIPLLLLCRHRPHLRKYCLQGIGIFLLASAGLSGWSYWRAYSAYQARSTSAVTLSLPHKPSALALERTVRVMRSATNFEVLREASCEKACQELLSQNGVDRIRISKTEVDMNGESRKAALLYRLGAGDECTRKTSQYTGNALQAGGEVAVYANLDTISDGQCLLARSATGEEPGFIEISVDAESREAAEATTSITIRDGASGTVLWRSREETAGVIAFPAMLQAGEQGFLRLSARFGVFGTRNSETIIRRILTEKMRYRISLENRLF